jgi:hypothetical protein
VGLGCQRGGGPLIGGRARSRDKGPHRCISKFAHGKFFLECDCSVARQGAEIECKALLPDPEIFDSIDSIYFVRCSLKKKEKGEKRQSRSHNAEAHSSNDHRVKWASIGH